jgi:hypothetical protein
LNCGRCPIQNLPHLHTPPLATISGGDLPGVELTSNCVAACVSSTLNFADDRQNALFGGDLDLQQARCILMRTIAARNPSTANGVKYRGAANRRCIKDRPKSGRPTTRWNSNLALCVG